MLTFKIHYDAVEIPKQRAEDEEVLKAMRSALAKPMVLTSGTNVIRPLDTKAEQVRGGVVVPLPLKKNTPSSVPPKTPAPIQQPLRPAAEISRDLAINGQFGIRKLAGDELRKLIR